MESGSLCSSFGLQSNINMPSGPGPPAAPLEGNVGLNNQVLKCTMGNGVLVSFARKGRLHILPIFFSCYS